MADIIDFPVSPQEYFYDSRNLVDRGWKWHFGLPTPDAAGAVPLSTAECGAMPFRDDTAVSGLISDKCLRGEDWVFLDNWQNDRRWIYHHGFTNLFGDVPELSGELQTKGPSSGQLTAFAGNMSALCSVWRSDFQWTGGDRELHVSSYLDAWEELSAGFVDIPRLHDAELSDSSLKLGRMKNFFDDTSKFACTAFDPLVVMQDGGSDARHLWWWHYRYGQPAEQESRFMQRVVFLVDDLYAGSANPNRVVGFDVQVFAVVMGTTQSSEGSSYKFGLIDLFNGRRAVAQALTTTSSNKFYISTSFGGNTAGQRIANALGMEFRPDPPAWGWVSFTADVLALHAVIWPKYLKL